MLSAQSVAFAVAHPLMALRTMLDAVATAAKAALGVDDDYESRIDARHELKR